MEKKDQKMLKFLLLADIHRNQKWLDALKEWHTTNYKDKYDFILIGGLIKFNFPYKIYKFIGDIDSVSTAEMGWNV